ncbi:unnamed protein product [Porites lobata]|uniref:RAD51 interacting motif domain-containing protein n=1 Tax=Porites lobata TaxID=104759 RepID=A0ABN8SA19_9CNID|nr:unnamed protein product [Porites lobata]
MPDPFNLDIRKRLTAERIYRRNYCFGANSFSRTIHAIYYSTFQKIFLTTSRRTNYFYLIFSSSSVSYPGMSLGRRSDRVRKKVDYSKFCEEEGESTNNSDDDFQNDTGPAPVKKAKTATKTKAKTKQEVTKSKTKDSGNLKRKERLSRDEKLYQKDLEAALQASIRESQMSSAGNDSSSNANDEGEGDISDEEDLRPSKPKKARLLPSSDTEDDDKENTGDGSGTNFERKSPSEEDDSSNDEVKPKQRSTINKTDAMKEDLDEEVQGEEVEPNQDGDFELSEELSDADNESDDQDDSDFNETEVKKKSKGRGRGKSTSSPARAGVKPRTSVTVTPLKMLKGRGKSKGRGSSANSSHSVSSSASNSPSISSTSNQPQQHQLKTTSTSLLRSSPGMGLGGINIKTSGPPIRIGLSRNVRVKPLHAHVSVQH